MRKLILSLLLVSTAAVPAIAQDGSSNWRRDRGGQSSSSDDSKLARPARAERSERSSSSDSGRQWRPNRARSSGDASATAATTAEPTRRPRFSRPAETTVQQSTTDARRSRSGDGSFTERLIERRRAQREGTVDTIRDGRTTERPVTTRHRDGDRQWSSQWRSDRRYDWRRYRDHNRSIFRFGRYYDPYGYNYRRFSIGFNLWPSYYGSSYWLDDPWMYRLPPAYGPYRWVRYWDDALLVNIYTGQVVDVERNFFW